MRRLVWLIWLGAASTALAQPTLQVPPAPPNLLHLSPSPVAPEPASGDSVRVMHRTVIRCAPSEQAYTCGELNEGDRVQLLEPPTGSSRFATITSPDKCHALVPAHAIEPRTLGIRRKIKQFPGDYIVQVKGGVKTLIDGDVPEGGAFLESHTTIPHGAQVTVVGVKAATIRGKREDYYVIKTHGKERRYVLANHLEGVRAITQPTYVPGSVPAAPLTTSPTPPQQALSPLQQFNLSTPNTPVAEMQESISPEVEAQLKAAEQAYQQGVRYHAWEDAKLRYVQLLDSDIPSVRILAINRLSFIRQHQAYPQVVSSRFPQDRVTKANPAPPPANADIWVPGGLAVAATTTSQPNQPKAIKEQTIRPTPEPGAASPVTPPSTIAGPTNVPVYQPPVTATPPAQTAPQAATPRQPVSGQLASTQAAPKQKATGRLYRAAQSDGLNPLYYLSNSQGGRLYYVRSWTNSGIALARFEGKVVEVEGQLVDRRRDELGGYQINIERIQELR